MDTVFVIGLIVSLVVVNYRLSRSILYPPFIFCMMWLLDMSLYSLHLVEMDSIHPETLLVISTGAVLFSAGGALGFIFPRSLIKTRLVLLNSFNYKFEKPAQSRQSNLIKCFFIAALAIGTCFLIRNTFIAAAIGPGDSFLARARNAGIEAANTGEQQFSLFPYILLWSIYLSVLFQLEQRDRYFWIMSGITFVGSIFSTGRTTLLELIAALTCVYLIKTDRLSFLSAIRFARWPFLIFLLLWIGLIFTNKDTSAFGNGVSQLLALFIVSYIVGPMVALDYFLRHPNDYLNTPHHTFKFFLGIASALHLIQYTPSPPYDVFISVPFPTNVYTIYKWYITDFGIYGALGVMALIGFFHTLLYLKARTGSELGILFFALTMYPAIMVIFDDQYTAFGSYINILLLGSLYMVLRSQPMLRLPPILRTRTLQG